MAEKTRYTDSELDEFRQIIEEKIEKAENDLVLIKSAYTNDANNGTEIDTFNIEELSVPPIPVDGNLLFLTAKGKLLAYK